MRGKSVAILFLFVLIVPPAATIGWLRFEKYQLKRQIKRKIMADVDKEELVKFKFSEKEIGTELDWEHAKEFEYQGQMYDVVHKQKLGDSTEFWCWWDHEETRLNKKLLAMTNRAFGHDPQKKEKETLVITFFKSLYWQAKMEWKSKKKSSTPKNWIPFQLTFYSISIAPPTPPPILS